MLRCEIPVKSEADRLLYEGLPPLMPVLDQLGEGALLIGGLATMAWLAARPVGLPIRATRDVDLGIDRAILGLRGDRAIVGKLLRAHGFKPGYAEEAFRFARETPAGVFVVDLLVAPGASARTSGPPCVGSESNSQARDRRLRADLPPTSAARRAASGRLWLLSGS